jgi:hypothetical protein
MSEATKKPDRKYVKGRFGSLDTEFGLIHQNFRVVDIIRRIRLMVRNERSNIKICPCCDQSIEDKTVSFTKQAVSGMYAVYCWLGEHERHEFETKEIKHLLDKTTYANIGHWKKFGGIFYRPEGEDGKRKGLWGMNMQRAEAFFKGERTAPTQIITDRFTNEINASTEKYIHEFPNIQDFLDENEVYQSRTLVDDSNARVTVRPTVPEYVQKPYKD